MEEDGCKCYNEDQINKNLKDLLNNKESIIEEKMADKTYTLAEIRAAESDLDSAKSSGLLSSTMKLSDYIVLKPQNVVVVPESKKAYKQIYGKKPKEGEGLIRYCKDGLRIYYDEQPGWIGTFNAIENGIEHDGNLYYSLSGFASDYLKVERPDRVTKEVNGWTDCYYRDDEKSHLYPMDNLRKK
jgi:hypothetical protein